MAEIIKATPLRNGRNNQVYRLDLKGEGNWDLFIHSAQKFHLNLSALSSPFPTEKTLILKKYFQHPDDLRPRLFSEFSFLQFAWEQNIRSISQPLVCHREENWALYSYLPGSPIEAATKEGIDQALRFFIQLNQHKEKADLPKASENWIHFQDHFLSIEKRLRRLLNAHHPLITPFLQQELLPKWEKIQTPSISHTLQPDQLCISPSDFGFHNSLFHEGTYYFLDFEYAGWDDPAKTVCDFFCQPKVPIPMDDFERVSHRMAQTAAQPELCLQRIQLAFKATRIKWCCIMLGGLLGTGKARRDFAKCEEEGQLEKTREYLYAI